MKSCQKQIHQIWARNLSKMPKALTRRTSINWEYPRTEKNIRKRQRTNLNQLKQAQDNLNAHLQSVKDLPYQQKQEEITMEHIESLDAIETFVHQSLQPVLTNFEQKKILLEIDRNAVQLVKSFYDLSPSSDQIELALKIWSITSKNCQQAVVQTKNETIQDNNNIVTNGELKHFPKHLEQQNRLFSLKLSAPSIASIIEARRRNIEKRVKQINEFKKATPKLQTPRFHRTHQTRAKHSIAD
ncbi:unnamed protein product [Didymodactylos carnosus]|uniref:Uncharacterized protein n=1 Tax=Didymodactylos carnosus TaxID=1234261 RepID=A0A814XFY8_9BILA|nr:unnamed protein product [Didymodactylos carnosus]CAF1215971.1 unnamed protein product [Didymodactylos carnosus]CAF3494728.1 unnamed protein product [Didymodactylos carnosus]CAF3979738.1 unnamed protein product [Didymodactylos carnosus]